MWFELGSGPVLLSYCVSVYFCASTFPSDWLLKWHLIDYSSSRPYFCAQLGLVLYCWGNKEKSHWIYSDCPIRANPWNKGNWRMLIFQAYFWVESVRTASPWWCWGVLGRCSLVNCSSLHMEDLLWTSELGPRFLPLLVVR